MLKDVTDTFDLLFTKSSFPLFPGDAKGSPPFGQLEKCLEIYCLTWHQGRYFFCFAVKGFHQCSRNAAGRHSSSRALKAALLVHCEHMAQLSYGAVTVKPHEALEFKQIECHVAIKIHLLEQHAHVL